MANLRRQLTPQWLLFVLLVPLVRVASASQTSIVGPPGSVLFGSFVALLPNGNIVVADPKWTDGTTEELGAVYLYTSGGQLISKLTGSSADDDVGSQIVVLAGGNFVVGSGAWSLNSSATHVGAVTWVNGTTGLSGTVSASNSLTGSQTNDSIGDDFGVFALPGGNYLVLSPSWANGSNTFAGAITWGSGTAGVKGAVSASNSLVGTHQGDQIGLGDDTNDHPRFTTLSNGNAVVASLDWANNTGAATWINASAGNHGAISSANSLVGAQAGDIVGYGDVVALTNGNYVVSSPYWSNGSTQAAGAATWGNGSTGTSGVVSASNSLVGTHANDQVSVPGLNLNLGITALSNGNYVVSSQSWNNAAGAATWANGATGTSGGVTTSNSLVGDAGDGVGYGVTALSNGNYVVASVDWGSSKGAVTWANGTTGLVGKVSANNSLTGSTASSDGPSVDGDRVGWSVAALTNGNYVVGSQFWNNGIGAATRLSGTGAFSGVVSTSNSLTGSVSGDAVSSRGIVALTNGNYVVISDDWSNGATTNAGAVTWGNGTATMSGTVGTTNSLTGSTSGDQIGDLGVFPLANGNYVVGSQNWSSSAAQEVGAVTWVNGSHATAAPVSAANSLVGSRFEDWVGFDEILTFPNSNYLVVSFDWDNGTLVDAGAVTEGRANGGTVGALSSANSVVGTAAFDGTRQSYDYDPSRDLLVVGQPVANIVFLFNSDSIFKNGFE
ncbi:MAG TPA: hypothetical protein VH082_08270 [Rudaea sp.]|jgi:hypothetical protein|nr:hypothetical protein [Rudaea sp.]